MGSSQSSSGSKRDQESDSLKGSVSTSLDPSQVIRGSCPSSLTRIGQGEISAGLLRGLADAAGAHPVQKEFLEVWCRLVYDEAKPQLRPGDTSMTLCTDLAYLEASITGEVGMMSDLASRFVAEGCCILETRMLAQMRNIIEETKAQTLTLWCRLKQIGSSSPGADVGFSIATHLEWVVSDLLMPPIRDQELFREHAEEELLKPMMFRSSILPIEPERALSVAMKGTPRNALLTALFFFKTLGFTKPEDTTVNVLTSCLANRYTINVFMGPKGITRCMLRLHGPRRPIAEDLSATCLGCRYKEEVLKVVGDQVLGNAPDSVDYVAEPRGYTVGVGFCT